MALEGFEAWITGRKRFQGGQRRSSAADRAGEDGRTKVNPLAFWDEDGSDRRISRAHDLPRHPLRGAGYRSIGCAICTRPVRPGEDRARRALVRTSARPNAAFMPPRVVDARGGGI